MKNDANEGVEQSAVMLRTLVRTCAERGALPDIAALVP